MSLATSDTATAAPPLQVVPSGAALGAEVRGLDLRDVTDATFATIHQA